MKIFSGNKTTNIIKKLKQKMHICGSPVFSHWSESITIICQIRFKLLFTIRITIDVSIINNVITENTDLSV